MHNKNKLSYKKHITAAITQIREESHRKELQFDTFCDFNERTKTA